jgi:hypothetical protein
VVQELPQKEVAAEEFQTTAAFQWPFKSRTANKILNSAIRVASCQVQEKTHRPAQAKLMEAAQIKSLIWMAQLLST